MTKGWRWNFTRRMYIPKATFALNCFGQFHQNKSLRPVLEVQLVSKKRQFSRPSGTLFVNAESVECHTLSCNWRFFRAAPNICFVLSQTLPPGDRFCNFALSFIVRCFSLTVRNCAAESPIIWPIVNSVNDKRVIPRSLFQDNNTCMSSP